MAYSFLTGTNSSTVGDLVNRRGEGFPFFVLAATRVFDFALSQLLLMLFRDLLCPTEIGSNPFLFVYVSYSFWFYTKLLR